jgi:hypothetical protein
MSVGFKEAGDENRTNNVVEEFITHIVKVIMSVVQIVAKGE